MKYTLCIFFTMVYLCNLSAQEIVTIDTSQYLVSYIPLPTAIAQTEKAISELDDQIARTQEIIKKQAAQLKQLETKKVQLETALKIMQNPPPTKSKSVTVPDTTPPVTKSATKAKKKPKAKQKKE